jgi:hypothetical protein
MMSMSEKTVADKMFLKHAKSVAIFNGGACPALVAQIPAGLIESGAAPVDLVLLCARNRRELEQYLAPAIARLGAKGALWIAYLKATAAKATDINRDSISAYAEQNGVTPVAIISVDGDWSALRLKRL